MINNRDATWDDRRTADALWMAQALDLAERGRGKVHPNPMVGAVLVKDNQLIGAGYHQIYGGPHGEVEALRDCINKGNDPRGATIYVTLEPCCHFGKTPPCTEALIEAGVERVVIATEDPNPLVGGKGITILKKAGISVAVGILRERALDQNKVFFHYMKTQSPYVILKSATSLDGKIATRLGESQWITSEVARQHAHGVRASVAAIMVGIGTVLADDPRLTCRLAEATGESNDGVQPTRKLIRIVIDSQLQIPLDARLVQSAEDVPLWVVCGLGVRPEKQGELTRKGVVVMEQPLDGEGHIDLKSLLSVLGQKKIDSLLIEGGGSLNDSALRAGIVNEVNFYIAPMLIGGTQAKNGIAGIGVNHLSEAVQLENMEVIALGKDLLIKGKVIRREVENVHGDC